MNFKDAYKSYNDEIRSNPDVLKTILESKTSEPEYKFGFRMMPAYAAALALVVSVSVFSYNHFHKSQEPTVRYIAANENAETKVLDKSDGLNNNETVAMVSGEDDNTASASEVLGVHSSAYKSETDINKENNSAPRLRQDAAKVHDKAYGKEIPDADSGYEIKKSVSDMLVENPVTDEDTSSSDKDFPLADDENTHNTADDNVFLPAKTAEKPIEAPVLNTDDDILSGRAVIASEDVAEEALPADNSAVALADAADVENPVATVADDDFCYMSYNEYKDYIGMDIQAKAKLPDDMIFEPMPSAKVEYENDTVISDMFTASAFSFENPNRNLSVSVTKNGPYAGRFSEDVGYAYGSDSDEILGAYVEVGDISVSIGVNNVTKDEVDTFINSLK